MLSLRKRCEKRLVGLKASRQPMEEDWREISRLAMPTRSRFLNSETNRNSRKRNMLYDGHGIRSFRTLTGGMTSGLSSSSRPWFKCELFDRDLMDDPDVKAWLDATEKRIYAMLAGSNFYGAAKTGYSENGLFGTEAAVIEADPIEGIVCHALTAGEYWIGLSKTGVPDTLYRRAPMTVVQAVQAFGIDRVSDRVRQAYNRHAYDEMVEVFHAIEPNTDRHDTMLAKDMPYRSVYWDEADSGDTLLRESGYEEKPFWCARWDTTGNDAWGTSPGMDALPDLRELQMQAKRKGEATDWVIFPEKVVPASVKLKNMPRSIVSASGVDAAKIEVPYQLPYQAISVIREDVMMCREAVDGASYADLFMAITNMQGIQPRNIEEIASRNEEKLTQLGPVIERVNNEKLEVALDRVFGIMSRGGLLDPAPEALQGKDIKFEFVSILTQMQRMVGIGQIERTAGFVGNLVAVFPEAADKLDIDEMIDEYADRAGAPPKMIRTKDAVDAIRAARAEAQQAEKMAAMMPAVQQGADAARLLSETDAGGGQSLLQNMMPA